MVPVVVGQAEANVWGGLRGIRVEGELMPLASGLRAVAPGAPVASDVRQERLGNAGFMRPSASRQISTGTLVTGAAVPRGAGGRRGGPLPAVTGQISYEDAEAGVVKVEIQITANADTPLVGVFYYLHLPGPDYIGAAVELDGAASPGVRPTDPAGVQVTGVRFVAAHRQLAIAFPAVETVWIGPAPGTSGGLDIRIPVSFGNLAAGQTASLLFTLKATGDVDKAPVSLVLDLAHPGSLFAGVGGNFRMQSPQDPAEVAYNLAHLNVVWARANLPLDQWQPQEDADPVATAAAGRLNGGVRTALEMQRTLAQAKIPLLLSVWSLPVWARTPVTPRPPDSGGPGQGSTYHLDPAKWDAVCKSIGAYLDYAKANYGVEPRLFSFNETDIGYDILETPAEQTEEIKRLGAFFAARGSPTKLVLGDTGDPTGFNFINDAMADPEAVKYIGAVSFHSWRGGTPEQFARWGAAAKTLGVPLLVAEGGMDSDAYRYQALLLEPWYARLEISEYIDICRYAQTLSILQWQLTENYSLLTGGRNGQPLAPAQRFWQLKQLGLTPAGSAALPITCDRSGINCCAFADAAKGTVAVHLVNNGAKRTAIVGGLPAGLTELRVYVTDAARGLQETGRVPVAGGTARLTLDATSYTTLLGAP